MCEANSISVGTAPARRTMSPITAALFMLAVYAGVSWIELQLQGKQKRAAQSNYCSETRCAALSFMDRMIGVIPGSAFGT